MQNADFKLKNAKLFSKKAPHFEICTFYFLKFIFYANLTRIPRPVDGDEWYKN